MRRNPQSQHYVHNVEAWLRASELACRGLLYLLHAMERQQTPEAHGQLRRAKQASAALEIAQLWVRKSFDQPKRKSRRNRRAGRPQHKERNRGQKS